VDLRYSTTVLDRRSFLRIGALVVPAVALSPLVGAQPTPVLAFSIAPAWPIVREILKLAGGAFFEEIGKSAGGYLAEKFGVSGKREPPEVGTAKDRGFGDTSYQVNVNISVNSTLLPMAHTDGRNAIAMFMNPDSLQLEAVAEGPTVIAMRAMADELPPQQRAGLLIPKGAYQGLPDGSSRRYFPASVQQAARFDQTWPSGIGYRTRDGSFGVYYEADLQRMMGTVSVALFDATERTLRHGSYSVPLTQV
jgi:hypothetical protein